MSCWIWPVNACNKHVACYFPTFHFKCALTHPPMENHRPDTVPSCRRGCVLSAGLGKVLTFLTHKIETFRSWKSKRFPPANHRRAGSYEPWRETDVSGSGSGRENLDSFVPLGWVTISINMKTQMQRVGCQNQRHFEWCKLPQSVLCLATWYPC